jgi:hypothetical protein
MAVTDPRLSVLIGPGATLAQKNTAVAALIASIDAANLQSGVAAGNGPVNELARQFHAQLAAVMAVDVSASPGPANNYSGSVGENPSNTSSFNRSGPLGRNSPQGG